MGGVLFTLELIADSLQGPVLLPPTALASAPPILGVRLMDLAPEFLDAPEGETYSPAVSSCVSFGGRGKALVFELADQLLHDHEACGRPLPLWLLALAAIRPSTARRSEATRAASATAAAATKAAGGSVLVASACVDLRQEVLHAQEAARRSSEHTSNPSASPFRRCGFKFTAVHGPSSELTLSCFFRVYEGRHIPMTGTALLQPAAVAAALPVAPVMPSSGAQAQDCSVSSRGASKQGPSQQWQQQQQRDAVTQTELTAQVHAAAATALAAMVLEGTHRSCHSQTTAEGPQQAQLPSQSGRGTAFFADEIRVHGGEVPAHVDASATVVQCHSAAFADTLPSASEAADPTTPSPYSGRPPEVSPSLTLVSELVRELWQIRSINS